MTELQKILLTSALTIAGGLTVFGLTQLFQRFCLEPLNEQAKAVGRAAFVLLFYGNCYGNPGKLDPVLLNEASRALRECASQLMATGNAVRCYPLFRLFRLVPDRNSLGRTVSILIGLSNSMFTGDGLENSQHADEARRLLGFTRI